LPGRHKPSLRHATVWSALPTGGAPQKSGGAHPKIFRATHFQIRSGAPVSITQSTDSSIPLMFCTIEWEDTNLNVRYLYVGPNTAVLSNFKHFVAYMLLFY